MNKKEIAEKLRNEIGHLELAIKKSQEGILTGQQSASQIASSLADDFNSI